VNSPDSTRILVVDYGKGNVRSVIKSLEQIGVQVVFSRRAADVYNVNGIVLPGVGSFADAAASLSETGQLEALGEVLSEGMPFLGICLGAQLLMESGEEGVAEVTNRFSPDATWVRGMALVEGYCLKLPNVDDEGRVYKIPHVGWNQVHYGESPQVRAALEALMQGVADDSNMYFTHSYQCVTRRAEDTLATTLHAQPYPSIIRRKNAFGVQFHPEKSSAKGLQVLANFVRFAASEAGR